MVQVLKKKPLIFSNSGPGRVVAIAAGNDNGSNIHKQNIIAPGSTGTISITLGNNTSTGDILGFYFTLIVQIIFLL